MALSLRDAYAETRKLRVVKPREPVLAKVGRALGRLANRLERTRTAALALAGFGCLTAAAWTTFGTGAGLAAVGASLLVLEYLSGGDRR